MSNTNAKNPTTIVTVAIAAILVLSAAGMGIRQLRREEVFSSPPPQTKSVESETKAPPESPPDVSRPDEQSHTWAQQEPEQKAWDTPAEPEPAPKEAPKPPQQTRPAPTRQPVQMVSSTPKLSNDEQDEMNYQYIQAIWPSLSEQDREEARRVMEKWPTMSEEERDYYRSLVKNLQ